MLPFSFLPSLFPTFTTPLFSSHFTLISFILCPFLVLPIHEVILYIQRLRLYLEFATQLFSYLYLLGNSFVERFYCIRPPDLKNAKHSLHVLSGFIYVCLSGRIIFSIHERNFYLDTRSMYQFDTYILFSSVRFTLRLVDSIFSIHHRIDLKFCNLFDNIFDCEKI